jgi:hypothetical protein
MERHERFRAETKNLNLSQFANYDVQKYVAAFILNCKELVVCNLNFGPPVDERAHSPMMLTSLLGYMRNAVSTFAGQSLWLRLGQDLCSSVGYDMIMI